MFLFGIKNKSRKLRLNISTCSGLFLFRSSIIQVLAVESPTQGSSRPPQLTGWRRESTTQDHPNEQTAPQDVTWDFGLNSSKNPKEHVCFCFGVFVETPLAPWWSTVRLIKGFDPKGFFSSLLTGRPRSSTIRGPYQVP